MDFNLNYYGLNNGVKVSKCQSVKLLAEVSVVP